LSFLHLLRGGTACDPAFSLALLEHKAPHSLGMVHCVGHRGPTACPRHTKQGKALQLGSFDNSFQIGDVFFKRKLDLMTIR
jgi:hypothetical protein